MQCIFRCSTTAKVYSFKRKSIVIKANRTRTDWQACSVVSNLLLYSEQHKLSAKLSLGSQLTTLSNVSMSQCTSFSTTLTPFFMAKISFSVSALNIRNRISVCDWQICRTVDMSKHIRKVNKRRSNHVPRLPLLTSGQKKRDPGNEVDKPP